MPKAFFMWVCGVVLLALVAEPSGAVAHDWTGNVNFTLGGKSLDKDDWDPVEDQGEFGIEVDFRQPSWPVNIAFALTGSNVTEDDIIIEGYSVEEEGSTSELRFGLRKIWEPTPSMRPFLGGGLAFIGAELEGRAPGGTTHDDDSSTGIWISGGIYWTIGTSFNLGFELGYSHADIKLFDEDFEAGGTHAALLMGYHW